ncbi:16962_t:CDS:2, partial [Cetraspora pellucida]
MPRQLEFEKVKKRLSDLALDCLELDVVDNDQDNESQDKNEDNEPDNETKNKNDCQDGSTNSEDTIEAGMPHDSQGHETNEINRQMDTQTKAYVEAIIQSSTNFIGNESNINRLRDNEPPTRQNSETSRTYTTYTTGTDYNTEQGKGNYLSTPVINSLIEKINSENTLLRETELDDVKSVKYKITSRKFSALSYVSLKPLSDVQ